MAYATIRVIRGLCLFFAGITCLPSSYGGRPLVTDDARVVDSKSCQLESWIKKNRDSTEYWAMPACNFTGNTELGVGAARTNDVTGTYASDNIIQLKSIFKPVDTNGWGIGVTIGTQRHLQSEHGGRDWYATIPVSISLADDRLFLHPNVGWLKEQETGRQYLTWGFASEAQLSERLSLFGEGFGQHQGKPFYQLGGQYSVVPDRVQMYASYGNRFGSGSQERWISLGLRLLTPRFLP